MKRPASAPVIGSAVKKAAKDPLAIKADEIAAMMEGAEGFPDTVVNMVSTTLDKSLLIPKDKRHAIQDEVVGMVEQVLTSVEKVRQSKVEAAQTKVAGSDSEKVVREQAVEAAKAVLAEKKAAADAAKVALEEAAGEDVTAKTAVADAKAEQKDGDAGYVAAAKKKSTLESMLAEEYETLKQGTCSTVKKSVQAVISVGKQFGFEHQLLLSAEPALSKAPTERGNFDHLVLQQMEEHVNSVIQQLDNELSTGEAAKAERAGKVEAAEAQLAATGERVQACKAEMVTTQNAVKDAESQCKVAEQALNDFGPELAQTASELEAANIELQGCEAVLATFRELRERTSVAETATLAEPSAIAEPEDEAVAAA